MLGNGLRIEPLVRKCRQGNFIETDFCQGGGMPIASKRVEIDRVNELRNGMLG